MSNMVRDQVCKEKQEIILVLQELTVEKRKWAYIPMFTKLGDTNHDTRKLSGS